VARPVVRVDAAETCGPEALAQHARIAGAFEVRSVLDVAADSGGRFVLTERALDVPYVKDYDAIEGNHPTRWAATFDLANWALFAAHRDGVQAGGAVVAFDTPGVDMLKGRTDLAILWDLRVAPEARGQGVGHALFGAAEEWARARGCRQLEIETQNVNLRACRFYARQGCELAGIDRAAYPHHPEEIQMIWRKDLRAGQAALR
jgi:GNAT superfamily N-acetyltransferase